MPNIHERVRRALAKAEKDRKAQEAKASASSNRSYAAKERAEVRHEERMELILQGVAVAKTKRERRDELRTMDEFFE